MLILMTVSEPESFPSSRVIVIWAQAHDSTHDSMRWPDFPGGTDPEPTTTATDGTETEKKDVPGNAGSGQENTVAESSAGTEGVGGRGRTAICVWIRFDQFVG